MVTPEELKAGGLIPQKQKQTVTVRCMAPGGRLTAERLHRIADVAEKYGQGVVHLSVRMSPEILHIKLQDIEAVTRELAEAGQHIASCGKRVRVPVACGGCEYNPNGLTDTQRLALEVNQRYFGLDQYHKFKICFSGCPNDCVRARQADLGFQGLLEPTLEADRCNGCGLCVRVCRERALRMKNRLPLRDTTHCIGCGDCVKNCPTDAMASAAVGHAVFVGGKHGRHPHIAYPVASLVPDELVFPVIETVLAWYAENGNRGQRIGETIDQVGINSLRKALLPVVGERLLSGDEVHQPRWESIYYAGLTDSFPAYEEIGTSGDEGNG